MHETMRAACEYAILKSASAVAVVVASTPPEQADDAPLDADVELELDLETLCGALRFEMLDARGTCACLAPLEELLTELEPRDLADAAVLAELHRLAPAVHVRELCRACAYLDAQAEPAAVARLVLDGVDLTHADDLVADRPSRTSPSRAALSDVRLPTDEEARACEAEWTALQRIAHELIGHVSQYAR